MSKNQKTIAVVFVILLAIGITLYLLRKKLKITQNGGGGNGGNGGNGGGGQPQPKWQGKIQRFEKGTVGALKVRFAQPVQLGTFTTANRIIISGGTKWDGEYAITAVQRAFITGTTNEVISGVFTDRTSGNAITEPMEKVQDPVSGNMYSNFAIATII